MFCEKSKFQSWNYFLKLQITVFVLFWIIQTIFYVYVIIILVHCFDIDCHFTSFRRRLVIIFFVVTFFNYFIFYRLLLLFFSFSHFNDNIDRTNKCLLAYGLHWAMPVLWWNSYIPATRNDNDSEDETEDHEDVKLKRIMIVMIMMKTTTARMMITKGKTLENEMSTCCAVDPSRFRWNCYLSPCLQATKYNVLSVRVCWDVQASNETRY